MSDRSKFAIVEIWPGAPGFHTFSGRHEFFKYSLVSRSYGDTLSSLKEPVALILLHDAGGKPLDLKRVTVRVDQHAVRTIHDGPELFAPILVLTDEPTPPRVAAYMQAGAYDVLANDAPVELLNARAIQLINDTESRAGDLRELVRVRRSRHLAEGIINSLVPIAVALTSETDMDRLVERILCDAMELCGAEGGTLYLRSENNNLGFRLVRNKVLDLHMGGADGEPIRFPPLPLHDRDTGQPNEHYVSCAAAVWGRSINIRDVYDERRFDLEGTKKFDAANGYQTRTMLTVPLRTVHDRVVGILQLINARDTDTGEPTPFSEDHERWLSALAKIAAAAMESCKRLETLQLKINHLNLDVDHTKRDEQVRQITETARFRDLKATAAALRARRERGALAT